MAAVGRSIRQTSLVAAAGTLAVDIRLVGIVEVVGILVKGPASRTGSADNRCIAGCIGCKGPTL